MSTTNEVDATLNSGYGSSDETASLLTVNEKNPVSSTKLSPEGSKLQISSLSSSNGPTIKPVLIRQDRTSTYLTSPQLSRAGFGGSDESDDQQKFLPEIELSCDLDSSTPVIAVSNTCETTESYQTVPYNRCRACRNCDRRASTTPVSTVTTSLKKSISKESIRSATLHGRYSPQLPKQQSSVIPPVLVTSSPTYGSRIIRQSSQPEQSTIPPSHCAAHSSPSVSLRQLKEPSDGISGIAADALRINGAMRPFKQVSI